MLTGSNYDLADTGFQNAQTEASFFENAPVAGADIPNTGTPDRLADEADVTAAALDAGVELGVTVMAGTGTPDRLADEADVTAAALDAGVELGVTVMEEGTLGSATASVVADVDLIVTFRIKWRSNRSGSTVAAISEESEEPFVSETEDDDNDTIDLLASMSEGGADAVFNSEQCFLSNKQQRLLTNQQAW